MILLKSFNKNTVHNFFRTIQTVEFHTLQLEYILEKNAILLKKKKVKWKVLHKSEKLV